MRTLEIVMKWDGKVTNMILGTQNLSEKYVEQLMGRLYKIAKSYTETGRPLLP